MSSKSKEELKKRLLGEDKDTDPRAALFHKRLNIPTPVVQETETVTGPPIEQPVVVQPVEQKKVQTPVQPTEEPPSVKENNVPAKPDSEIKLELIESTDTRQTYYLTLQYVEALRILAFSDRKGISETLRELLDIALAENAPGVMEEAKRNLMKMSVQQLTDLKAKKRLKK